MRSATATFLVLAASFAVFLATPAEARQGRGRDDVAADASSPVAGAGLSIRLRERSGGRWEFRMQMENAAPVLAPSVFLADASGTLVLAGSLVPDDNDVGEYKLRLRSQKGGTLPVGASSITELGGRAYEVRENGGVIFSGTLPLVGTKSSTASGGGSGRGGADDPATHDVGDDRGGGSGRGRGRGTDDPKKRGADDAAGRR